MTTKKTHLHYIIWGYDRVEPTTGNYVDNTVIDIIADSEAAALTKAKKSPTPNNSPHWT